MAAPTSIPIHRAGRGDRLGPRGIENRIDPGGRSPATPTGEALAKERALPRSLGEAAERLKGSQAAPASSATPSSTITPATREWEEREARKAITDWQLARSSSRLSEEPCRTYICISPVDEKSSVRGQQAPRSPPSSRRAEASEWRRASRSAGRAKAFLDAPSPCRAGLAWQMGRPVRYGGELGGVEERTAYMAAIADESLPGFSRTATGFRRLSPASRSASCWSSRPGTIPFSRRSTPSSRR